MRLAPHEPVRYYAVRNQTPSGKECTISLTKRHLVQTLVDDLGSARPSAQQAVNAVFSELARAIISGDRVEIRGFGSWTVRTTNPNRESTESWLEVLRDLRDRGLEQPVLIAADGNMGIWAAVDQVWPNSRQQRCWNHKIINVLDKVPKRTQTEARTLLVQIPYAHTRQEAENLRKRFATRYCSQFPNAVETLERDWDRMITFYDLPKKHWKHLRTTNVVESPFASVRLRTNAAKRHKKVANATALIWRTLMVAEKRFRKLDAPHLLKDVYARKQYQDGTAITVGNRVAA